MELAGYLVTFGLAALYAMFLHKLDRRYEPDWTIATVVGGVALTGCGVAIRLYAGALPALHSAALVWWVWWLFVTHFAASGLAIAIWQIYQAKRRLDVYIAYLRGKHGNAPDEAAGLAAPRARRSR